MALSLAATAAAAAPVAEEIVEFATHDSLVLAGVLSYPADTTGPFPGMLLISGSGLHDADVTLDEPTLQMTRGRQKLFRSLARQFSRRGWAVLRYNKRGASFDHLTDRPAILEASTVDDLVEDARNALSTLLEHPRVAARPLVVYGHSEGTAVAARLARDQSEIDLLVLVGSVARPLREILQYQLVERHLHFLREAADADRNGALTLAELDALDGNHGLGSIYVLNIANVLFSLSRLPEGDIQIHGFHPATDLNGDGRLEISSELEPRLTEELQRLLDLARSGAFGQYQQSLVKLGDSRSFIHRLEAPILFVHGALDVQTPLEEALLLIERLERRGRRDYDLLVFPRLGHSLSRPNDYYAGDGGLTILDNPTLNAASRATHRRILRRIERILPR